MKTTNTILTFLYLFGGAIYTSQASPNIPGAAAKPASYFYTGKPYDKDLGSYVFLGRTYNTDTTQWTTADPTGFPDGANNRIYSPAPTQELDPTGYTDMYVDSFSAFDSGSVNLGSVTTIYGNTFDLYQVSSLSISIDADSTYTPFDSASITVSGSATRSYSVKNSDGQITGVSSDTISVSQQFKISINTTTGIITISPAQGSDAAGADSYGMSVGLGEEQDGTGGSAATVYFGANTMGIYQGAGFTGAGFSTAFGD